LHSNELSGKVPETFGYLEKLEDLNLSKNSLTGAVAPGMWKLPRLSLLDLHSNYISGDIPKDAKLPLLKYLDLEANPIDGTFPASAFSSSSDKLRSVFLRDTSLAPDDWDALCSLPSLKDLKIDCSTQQMASLECPCCALACQ
jgi:hypothetical protein